MARKSRLCAAALLVQGLVTTTSVAQQAEPEKYRVAIALRSEQALADLTQALITLIPDASQPHLQMPPDRAAGAIAKIESQGKDGRYHLNPQPKMLDLAVALKVWPEAADDIRILPDPEFYKRFGPRVTKDPSTAFPDVVVTRHPFRLRLLVSSALKPPRAALYKEKGKALLDEDRIELCDPKLTLLARADCRVEIRDRAFEDEPFIERLQMGFRVETRAALPRAMAERIGQQVRVAIERYRGPKIPESDVLAVLIPESGWRANSQQAQSQQEVFAKALPLDVTATELHDVWKRARGSPHDLLPSNPSSQWPTINLYDAVASNDQSILYKDWLARLVQAPYGPAGPDCSELRPNLPSHTDAAASLLFPFFVESRLLPQSDIPAVPDNYFRGAIRGVRQLYDPPAESPDSFDANSQPVIGLAVFTDRWREQEARRLANALSHPLTSRVLIVSTPEKRVVHPNHGTSFLRLPSYQLDPDASSAVSSCKDMPLPACLGVLPRVLVVAPVEHLLKYVIGSTVVGIAAPGNEVPVLHNCRLDDQPPQRWARSRGTGSSFAAPLVAAVVAKIVSSSSAGRAAARDPLVAMLRVLATADPLTPTEGLQSEDVAYGKLNAGRALKGAAADEESSDYKATVYRTNGQAQFLVISPYPWTRDYENMHPAPKSTIAGAKRLGLAHRPRGVFRAETDGVSQSNNDFRNILRIVKRKETDDSGRMLFDIFYLGRGANAKAARRVKVLSKVPLGSFGFDPNREGHCSETNASSTFPACLYFWDGSNPKGFQPLDFTQVDEIVLSPNHFEAPFVAGFHPVDFILADQNGVTGRPLNSPWRRAFCDTGIHVDVLNAILRAQYPSDGAPDTIAKMNRLRQAYGAYCAADS